MLKNASEKLSRIKVNFTASECICFVPWIIAIFLVVLIECGYFFIYKPNRVERTNFLQLDFANTDSVQRLIAYEKLRDLAATPAQIIQVGDSSGLHGVQPNLVSAHLDGVSYVNLSVATNLGYLGYYEVAKFALERNPNARILVLYTSMLIAPPRGELWNPGNKLLGESINKEFSNRLHQIIQLPTLAARKTLTDRLYYLNKTFKAENAPLSSNYGYLIFNNIFLQSLGWTRETDVEGDVQKDIWQSVYDVLEGRTPQSMPPDVLRLFRSGLGDGEMDFFDWNRLVKRSYMEEVYSAFSDLASKHKVALVIIHNPLPSGVRSSKLMPVFQLRKLEDRLRFFQAKYPDVTVQTTFDYWPDRKFSVFSHVGTAYSAESSYRVAEFLRPIVKRLFIQAPLSSLEAPATKIVDFTQPFSGYRWSEVDKNGLRHPISGASQTLIFTRLAVGTGYQMVANVSAETAATCSDRVLGVVNGNVLSAPGKVMQGQSKLQWPIPKSAVGVNNGWTQIMFSLDGSEVWHGRLDSDFKQYCHNFDVGSILFEPQQK
ncbi:hypothetical protein [Polynucleobacter paneuropaeus]|uniref:hypothetical protein n=1 Tax=Polynucleobacter paneuropaeus TaxID=2527775 RepID=UPI001BFE1969|nr:hypothetical protein [Polynucleobacter paneuropaeus]MBT8621909.1 hypothetical protein [Polynucleobacter paneuropaeus]